MRTCDKIALQQCTHWLLAIIYYASDKVACQNCSITHTLLESWDKTIWQRNLYHYSQAVGQWEFLAGKKCSVSHLLFVMGYVLWECIMEKMASVTDFLVANEWYLIRQPRWKQMSCNTHPVVHGIRSDDSDQTYLQHSPPWSWDMVRLACREDLWVVTHILHMILMKIPAKRAAVPLTVLHCIGWGLMKILVKNKTAVQLTSCWSCNECPAERTTVTHMLLVTNDMWQICPAEEIAGLQAVGHEQDDIKKFPCCLLPADHDEQCNIKKCPCGLLPQAIDHEEQDDIKKCPCCLLPIDHQISRIWWEFKGAHNLWAMSWDVIKLWNRMKYSITHHLWVGI